MAEKYNLKCRIRKGMFDNEYLVIFEAFGPNGKKVQMCTFADKEEISVNSFPNNENEEVDAYISVSPLDLQKRISSVALPRPTFANGTVVVIESCNLVGT